MNEHYEFSLSINPAPARNELNVLFCGYGKPLPLHRMGPAVHDYYLLHTVVGGSGMFELGGKAFRCGTGDSFLIFPGELFRYEADGQLPWTYHWVGFRGHLAAAILATLGFSEQNPVKHVHRLKQLTDCYLRLQQLLGDADAWPALKDLESGGLLRQLLARIAADHPPVGQPPMSHQTPINEQIEQAVLWLSMHYERSLSIEQIARSLGYHRTHLSKMFKQAVGLSPMQYLFQIRMNRAEALLDKQLTIAQVAASVGYADALYFSKQFRKYKGMSPTAYRERLRR